MAGDKVSLRPPCTELTSQPYVTELDFQHASLPTETMRFLQEVMPGREGEEEVADGGNTCYDCE